MARKEYCKPCDEDVMSIDGDCPLCGDKIGIPESEMIRADE